MLLMPIESSSLHFHVLFHLSNLRDSIYDFRHQKMKYAKEECVSNHDHVSELSR